MATGQVALTRHRAPTSVQRGSKPAVPAFLQKLHEMVNDPNNAELIRWSDAGDSFFVLDHERFAREVLGRWFKHQNFASFVRQLNMYGFHKIPHLQQGVLKSDTDTEHWNFAHPSFLRGQPELLSLIQRKKQPQHGEDVIMDVREAITAAPPAAPLQASGQVVDVHSLLNNIATIKRNQSTISAELSELKQSNQLLWANALEARDKHQKQQDTINRIVKFLAGVFGSRASSHKDDLVDSSDSRAVVPRRRSRFLIEDGRFEKAGGDNDQDMSHDGFENIGDQASQPYPIIETPGSIPSPSPSENESLMGAFTSTTRPTPSTETLLSTAPSSTPTPKQVPTITTPTDVSDRSVTPTRSSPGLDMDRFQLLMNGLNQLPPHQIQQLLSTVPGMDPTPSNEPTVNTTSSQITQYTPPLDIFSQFMNPPPGSEHIPMDADGLLSFENQHELGLPDHNMSNVNKQWNGIADIERDVNASNADIDAIIKSLGLHPTVRADTGSAESSPSTSSLHLENDDSHPDPRAVPPPVGTTHSQTQNPDPATSTSHSDSLFDFDTFFNTFDPNVISTTANPSFLTQSSSVSETQQQPLQSSSTQQQTLQHQQGAPIPGMRVTSGTSKRKSDASDLVIPPIDDMGINTTTLSLNASPSKPTKRRKK